VGRSGGCRPCRRRLGERLADVDADVLDGVVGVDVQVTLGLDIEVDQAVARHLSSICSKERDAGVERPAPVPSR